MIDDPLEGQKAFLLALLPSQHADRTGSPRPFRPAECKASDLILARSLGLISKLKRHAFYKLVRRQGSPQDGDRMERIMAVERERLDGVEQRRRERLARVRREAEETDEQEA